jgi:hypothetical protein
MSNKCPRGFVVSESTGKCVPEGKSISDRLMLKYERYFFKEDKDMEKCKPGFRWCSKTNKCVEDTPDKLQGKKLGRGQGKGPMGKPFKEASELVDVALDEGLEPFAKLVAARNKADKILDLVKFECDCGCGVKPMGSQDDENEEEFADKFEDAYDAMDHVGPNDIDAVPQQEPDKLYASVRKQLGEIRVLNKESREEYRAFFNSMLKKYGVSSPSQLDDAKKKEFFDAVDKGWQAKKETD